MRRIEATAPEVRCLRVSAEGQLHGDADATVDDAEILFRGWLAAPVFDHLLGRAPRLRWIHSAAAGVEGLVTSLARARGVILTNARGVFSRPIAEYIVLMILAASRRLPQLLELQRERTWQPLQAAELADLTVGIVGYGSIGHEVAALLAPFGVRIVATRQHPERDASAPDPVRLMPAEALDELLAMSDVVVLTVPLTPRTDGLIGARAFQVMKDGAHLINVSRGRLIDEVALLRALESGWIAGAVLDVFREEPLPPTSPLYGAPNLILTPHTSWWSGRVLDRSVDLFVANLGRYLGGEPLENVVDLGAGY
ncbi:MAG: D-2-hydroxyacid dehydrogenase [Chloroflexota bacterium]|nr:D-2-hydroxyacid dehydrogenase [Chloroflexota bacterium]